ncbi:Ig-like domain-containing protein [Roseobacter sp. N2S]|uniref:Ig-like domain-containing protein n=1 Tax=Roseobacter sp. N2S TaxID=2663844 RepID=UPI002867A8CF|nr:Ig-like domain-containing protein [Roseobacter sp. N2S]MDR6265897.1 VCBS repeat-containing protein [Roseobacter sp. N2S]
MTATNNDDLITNATSLEPVNVDGLDGSDSIIGSEFDDTLSGSKGRDRISGLGGDDFLDGGFGKDVLIGGAGNDSVLGGINDDELDGGLGDDTLDGGAGVDHLFGRIGDDHLFGGRGADVLNGGSGDDQLFGGIGADVINSGSGNDFVVGGWGADELYGHSGNDSIRGGKGKDQISGGSGDDTIIGGQDNDTLFGGNGTDTAVFNGSLHDYSWSVSGNTVTVTDNSTRNGDSGQDTLKGFEVLQFNDGVIYLGGVNNVPLLSGNDTSVTEDASVSFNLTATDFDGDNLVFSGFTYTGAGLISVGAMLPGSLGGFSTLTANFTFSTNSGFDSLEVGETAIEQVTFTFSDGNGGVVSHTVDITVTGVNDAPVAQAGTASGDEDTVISGSVAATDVDLDGLTFALETDGTNGTVLMNANGSYTYTPATDFNGSDSFTYTVSDGNGGTDTQTVTITVDAVNDTPVAQAGTASGDEDTVISGSVAATDVDLDGLTFALETDGTNGTVLMNANGSYTYTPAADFNGSDSFTYTVSDGNGGTDTQTVTITVDAVNDAPVAQAGTASGDEDTVISGSVAATDVDLDGLTFALETDGTNGTVLMNANGSYTYTPAADFNGSDSFTYTVSDGNGGTDTQTVTITVDAVNDAPVAQAGTASGDEDTVISGSVAATDVDLDGLTFALETDGTNGTVLMNANGSYTYTPATDFNGSDSFTYTVSDGNGGTDTQTVTITIDAVNDAPVAQAATVTGDEDTVISGSVAATDVDLDGLTFALETDGTNGTVLMNANGSYTYTPATDFNGSDSFTYTVSDGNGGTDTQTVTITVDAVNDTPVAQAGTASGDEDTVISGSVAATDVDLDGLTFALETDGTNGTVLMNANGSYTYTPAADFNGSDSFTYTVSDGNGGTDTQTVTITVDAVNDAPVAQAATVTGDEDTIISGTVVATDVEGDSLTYSLVTDGTNGSVALRADGSYAYTPSSNFNGTDSFTFSVSDGNGGTDTQTISITVDAVNDAPVALTVEGNLLEDGALNANLVATDIDGDTLTFTLQSSTSNGTLTLATDGSYTYTPAADFNGSDSFTYTVSDGNGATDTQTVLLSVGSVNDAPVVVSTIPGLSVDEADGLATINLNPYVSDIETSQLSFSFVGLVDSTTGRSVPIGVSFMDGVASFNPSELDLALGQSLNGTLTFRADDGSGATNSGVTFSIELDVLGSDDPTPVNTNTAPVASDLSVTKGDIDPIVIDLNELVSDADAGDTLTFGNIVISGSGRSETVVFSLENGILTIDPAQFNIEPDEVTGIAPEVELEISYVVNDGSGKANNTDTGTISLTIEDGAGPVVTPPTPNTQPVFTDDTITLTPTNQDILIDLSELASDADLDDLTFTVTFSSGTELGFSVNGSILRIPYTDSDILGLGASDSITTIFEVTVDDGTGAINATSVGNVTLELNGPYEPTATTNNAPTVTTPLYGIEISGTEYDLVTYADNGGLELSETDRELITNPIFSIDLDDFTSDSDGGDILSFSDISVDIGLNEETGEAISVSYVFDAVENTVSFDVTDLGLADGEETPVNINFTVTDDSGEANDTTLGKITIAASDPVAPVVGPTTFDFEEYSPADGNSVSIDGVDGFLFVGTSSVIETDEGSGDPLRPFPEGLTNGQTTTDGDNVLIVNDDIGGDPFAIYSEDTTQRISNDPTAVTGFAPPNQTFETLGGQDSFGYGTNFNLEGISLNPSASDGVTITLVSYRVVLIETPINASFSSYTADYEEVDSFEFILDASTGALVIDFGTAAYDDPLAEYDSKFDDISAFEIYASDGSKVVVDDMIIDHSEV